MRAALANLVSTTGHPGLVLDTRITTQDRSDTKARRAVIDQAVNIKPPNVYGEFLSRWRAALTAPGSETEIRPARALARVIVGLGAESVIETAITLHRTYGVPYLPGTSLKGLAASYARQRLDPKEWDPSLEKGAYQTLFGTTDESGYVTFHDALPTSSVRLKRDVMTVHHADYYMSGTVPPADWDAPNPVAFVTVAPGAEFLVAISGPPEWRQAAYEILALALEEYGIGGKTNAGYGRLKLKEAAPGAQAGIGDAGSRLVERLVAIRPNQLAGTIHNIVAEWRRLPENERPAVAQAILSHLEKLGMRKQFRDKPWMLELAPPNP